MAGWVSAHIVIVNSNSAAVKSGCSAFGKHVGRNENRFLLLRATLLDKGSLKSLCEIEQAHMAIVVQASMLLKFLSV